jgi:hypothetical protein
MRPWGLLAWGADPAGASAASDRAGGFRPQLAIHFEPALSLEVSHGSFGVDAIIATPLSGRNQASERELKRATRSAGIADPQGPISEARRKGRLRRRHMRERR